MTTKAKIIYAHQVNDYCHEIRKQVKTLEVIVIYGNFKDIKRKDIFNVQIRNVGDYILSDTCKVFNKDLWELNGDLDEIGTFPIALMNLDS